MVGSLADRAKKLPPLPTKNSKDSIRIRGFAEVSEDLKFEILDSFIKKAGDLDAEIKLAKSPKEATSDKPVDVNLKRKRGETK